VDHPASADRIREEEQGSSDKNMRESGDASASPGWATRMTLGREIGRCHAGMPSAGADIVGGNDSGRTTLVKVQDAFVRLLDRPRGRLADA
jgi:hypothetical protein